MRRFFIVHLLLLGTITIAGKSTALGQTDAAASKKPENGVIINAHHQPEYGQPIPFRKISGTAGTLALEISGGRLYALENKGLSIYNIDDPQHPKKLGQAAWAMCGNCGSGERRRF